MPNTDGSDLGRLEQKIPHLQFLMELFTDREHLHRWDDQRKARFERVQRILLHCWNDIQHYAQQMANNAEFRAMMAALQTAFAALKTVQRHIQEAPVRMARYLELLNWDVGPGVRIT